MPVTYYGDYPVNGTVEIPWNTNGQDGASITRATDGTLKIFKGHSTTERSSLNGVTQVEDFGSLTGVHWITIDLSDDTDAGFYEPGADYTLVYSGMTIDGKTVNAAIAVFSIGRTGVGSVFYGSVTADPGFDHFTDSKLTQSGTDDWQGRILIFLTGANRYLAAEITAFEPSTDTLTYTTMNAAPSVGDRYMLC